MKKRERNKLRKETSEADSYQKVRPEELSQQIMQMAESPLTKNHLDSKGNLLDGGILLKSTVKLEERTPSFQLNDVDMKSKTSDAQKSTGKEVPKDSTGGSGENKNSNIRKDRFGIKITRGKKKHKVTFRDQVGKGKVAKVHYVESFKKYNVETTNST